MIYHNIKKIHKKAFTLIEVIMSVVIVSIVVMGAMQIQEQNSDMATYLLKRGSSELDNAVFLTENIKRYHKDEKNAYDMLIDEFSIKDLESRDILKGIEKKIHITEEAEIPVGQTEEEEPLFVFYSSEILLNGDYPARYYTFK